MRPVFRETEPPKPSTKLSQELASALHKSHKSHKSQPSHSALPTPLSAIRATRAEAASRTAAAHSRQVVKFLTDLLDGVGPSKALGRDSKMLREILDHTARRVGQDLNHQPEVQAELLNTLGNVYIELGAYAKADAMIRQALAMQRKLMGGEHPEAAVSPKKGEQ